MLKVEKEDGVMSGGRRVIDNHGPILMSPGGSFNIPKKEDSFGFGCSPATPPPEKSNGSSSSAVDVKTSELKKKRKESSDHKSIRQLFGGALSMQVPSSFQDVSIIREVR